MDERKLKTKKSYEAISNLYQQDFEKDSEGFELIDLAIELLKRKDGSNLKVVDLGSGPGNVIDYLLSHKLADARIEAVDFTDRFIEQLKAKYSDKNNIRIVNSEILDYLKAQSNSSVELFIASYSIIHIPDEEINDLFKEIFRVLVKGGVFVMSVHKGDYKGLENEPYWTQSDTRLKTTETLENYMNYFTEKELTERLAEAQFNIL